LYTGGKVPSIADGIKLAADTIDSGKAFEKLKLYRALSNE
jgi:anthranilate phosphoribosyltransferase